MSAWKAFWGGMADWRRALPSAALLYLATLLFSTLALVPAGAGFHAVLDRAPAAAAFLKGGGADLLAEMGRGSGPGLFASALSGPRSLGPLYIPVALFLLAGVYAASGRPGCRLRDAFGRGAAGLFLPFLGLFLLNLLVLAACLILAALPAVGIFALLPEGPDPGPGWWAFLGSAAWAAVVLTLWRNSVGFGQAAQVLGAPGGLGRVFLGGLGFSLRRLIPVNLMAWGVNALRIAVAYLTFAAFRPGYATTGAWLASALQLQAGFFALAYLRAAEVGMQVRYLRHRWELAERTAPVEFPEPQAAPDSPGVPVLAPEVPAEATPDISGPEIPEGLTGLPGEARPEGPQP